VLETGNFHSAPDVEESRCMPSNPSSNAKVENAGEPVTRTQQWRILSSACLVAFTVLGSYRDTFLALSSVSSLTAIGLNQSFGVFQAYYGRPKSVQEGVFHGNEFLNRSLISVVGSLSNGGIVAALGAFYYPYLSQLRGHITSLCAAGAVLVALGFAAAALSHNVKTLEQL